MQLINPWQPPEVGSFEPQKRMRLGRKLFLTLCIAAWVTFFALLSLQYYLEWRFPGLRDYASKPASYWPGDVCSVAADVAAFALLFAFASTITFVATRHFTSRLRR